MLHVSMVTETSLIGGFGILGIGGVFCVELKYLEIKCLSQKKGGLCPLQEQVPPFNDSIAQVFGK